jgi:hypothetical protein
MPSTKLWLVTQVAIPMTASPIMDASSTRQPSCSRIGIRILTIDTATRGSAEGSWRDKGAGPRDLGTQRLSVGDGAGELDDARDEAGGEGRSRSVSHSLQRVSGVRFVGDVWERAAK